MIGMTTILRKASTGETGNAGEFGTHTRADATVSLERDQPLAAALTSLGRHIAEAYPGASDIEFEWDSENGVLLPYAVYVDDDEAWSWVATQATADDRRTTDLAAEAAALFSRRTAAAPTELTVSDRGFRYSIPSA
jgi:hypothetical protein